MSRQLPVPFTWPAFAVSVAPPWAPYTPGNNFSSLQGPGERPTERARDSIGLQKRDSTYDGLPHGCKFRDSHERGPMWTSDVL